MPEITSLPKTYRISKPRVDGAQAAHAVDDVDLDAVAAQIESLAQAFGMLDEDGKTIPAAEVEQTLENSRRGKHTIVAKMTDKVRSQIEKLHGDSLLVVEDVVIDPMRGGTFDEMVLPMNHFPVDTDQELSFKIRVEGPDGQKISGAKVSLQGGIWYDEGLTSAKGLVTLVMYEETPDSLRRLIIKPVDGYWSRVVERPALVAGQINTIKLVPLGEGLGQPNFPQTQLQSWGMTDMGLTPSTAAAVPVRVAVIDSGIDASHPDLAPGTGRDFGESDAPDQSWSNDGSGHGTHVAGMIAGLDNAMGVVGGTAAGAQVFANRVFPNARISKLIAAIDWCIDNEIDVVNMSLGGKASDQGFEDALLDAQDAGILCVAATGNAATDVMYPAKYASVLAVAALGKLGSFPDDSSFAGQVSDKTAGAYFAASFTCFGPEVDVCAPGVAIVSTLPGGGHAPWSGTSMACPHVAAFAARLLQERSDLRDMPRNASRAKALFQAVKDSCVDLGLPPEYQGAGLPSLRSDLPPPPAPPTPDTVASAESRAVDMIDAAITLLTEPA